MRKTCLIAALLAVSAAGAHAQPQCRGETLSELNACVEAATAPPPEPVEEAAPAPTRRATVGGALQPRNLRAAPPRAGPPIAAPRTATPDDVGPDRADAAGSRYVTTYGLVGPSARASRNAPGTPDIGTRGVDDPIDVPGTLGTPPPAVPTPPRPGEP